MKIEIESTEKIVTLNGVSARIWEGCTKDGIKVHCFMTMIFPQTNKNLEQFNKELQEHKPPSADINSYPLRMIL